MPPGEQAHAALAHMIGATGDLAHTEAEFDKALDLNPNSADILTWYAGWANSFGKGDEGAEAADRARRLNPNMPTWALGLYRYAYFMAGRVEDALRMLYRSEVSIAAKELDGAVDADSLARAAEVALAELEPAADIHATRAYREQLVRVINLSREGAMVTPALRLRIGEPVSLRLAGDVRVDGAIRWIRDGRMGLNFAAPLEFEAP